MPASGTLPSHGARSCQQPWGAGRLPPHGKRRLASSVTGRRRRRPQGRRRMLPGYGARSCQQPGEAGRLPPHGKRRLASGILGSGLTQGLRWSRRRPQRGAGRLRRLRERRRHAAVTLSGQLRQHAISATGTRFSRSSGGRGQRDLDLGVSDAAEGRRSRARRSAVAARRRPAAATGTHREAGRLPPRGKRRLAASVTGRRRPRSGSAAEKLPGYGARSYQQPGRGRPAAAPRDAETRLQHPWPLARKGAPGPRSAKLPAARGSKRAAAPWATKSRRAHLPPPRKASCASSWTWEPRCQCAAQAARDPSPPPQRCEEPPEPQCHVACQR